MTSKEHSPEPVRLIIWDLDETYWKGTLSEEGITCYETANHDLVISLAKRGIMSSICSKNDYNDVKAVLEGKGIWEYFIFPSVDWTSKADRVAAIVDAVQLRPETVVFIDDNPSNRAAVAARVPGLRALPETIISEIKNNGLFVGKKDESLSRLKQYKLLEQRRAKQESASDNKSFLRESGIEVDIEVNLDEHFSRIVELINRTNQLNFTKNRLPEGEAEAIEQLKLQLNSHEVQAGLVRVKDRYGDYGYCGFFLMRWKVLQYYCFSCRIMGFGVETWLYQTLYRPRIDVKGEVAVDLFCPSPIDWINVAKLGGEGRAATAQSISSIAIRAHCEVGMVAHYFHFGDAQIYGEGGTKASRFSLAGDSLANMCSLSGIGWQLAAEDLAPLGFNSTAACQIFSGKGSPNPIVIFSCRDFRHPIYKHKAKDVFLNMFLDDTWVDLCRVPSAFLHEHIKKITDNPEEAQYVVDGLERFRGHYDSIEPNLPEISLLERSFLKKIASNLHSNTNLFVVLRHPKVRKSRDELVESPLIMEHRSMIESEASMNPKIVPIDLIDCVESDDEIVDVVHYQRIVYYRLYKKIIQRFAEINKDACW